jgi:hypothetical protein
MRSNAIDFENLIARPGLSCLWASTGETETAYLMARWIESQEETPEPFSTFAACSQFFTENSSNYSPARLARALPLLQA